MFFLNAHTETSEIPLEYENSFIQEVHSERSFKVRYPWRMPKNAAAIWHGNEELESAKQCKWRSQHARLSSCRSFNVILSIARLIYSLSVMSAESPAAQHRASSLSSYLWTWHQQSISCFRTSLSLAWYCSMHASIAKSWATDKELGLAANEASCPWHWVHQSLGQHRISPAMPGTAAILRYDF